MASDKPPPSLAPLNELSREIQAVLELIRPVGEEIGPKYEGYCGAASEAYLHLAGGRSSGLKVKRYEHHWWLEDDAGRVIDLTLAPVDRRRPHGLRGLFQRRFPYEKGKGAMFRRGYKDPSKRAQAIIELVKSRRRSK